MRGLLQALMILIAFSVLVTVAGAEIEGDRRETASANEETTDMGWKETLKNHTDRAVGDLDELVDVRWRGFVERMGFEEPRHIAAYNGYGNHERIWVQGRLLADKPYGGPRDDDNWWDNLKATYNRWESDEVPDTPVELEYAGTRRTVVTDDEGYYAAEFEIDPESPRTDVVIARHRLEDRTLTATHKIALPGEKADFLLISDMDDTVIHTGITDLLLSAQLTFLNNAKTRKPLAGVASLYRELARGADGNAGNPVIYLSNSAWNMYDLLRDFLILNDLPRGPLLLRDIGLGSDTSDHKIETLARLFERFDHLPVILIGDSGQHDAEIYSKVAARYPDRVRAIYIRDVDPHDDSEYDGNVDAIIERSHELGIPFLRVRDSAEIARHAVRAGMLEESQVAAVVREVERDQNRDSLAEVVTPGGEG